MLNIEHFKRINAFYNYVLEDTFVREHHNAFRECVAAGISHWFNLHHLMFGFLDRLNTPQISHNIRIEDIRIQFAQRFLSHRFFYNENTSKLADFYVHSCTPN